MNQKKKEKNNSDAHLHPLQRLPRCVHSQPQPPPSWSRVGLHSSILVRKTGGGYFMFHLICHIRYGVWSSPILVKNRCPSPLVHPTSLASFITSPFRELLGPPSRVSKRSGTGDLVACFLETFFIWRLSILFLDCKRGIHLGPHLPGAARLAQAPPFCPFQRHSGVATDRVVKVVRTARSSSSPIPCEMKGHLFTS